MKSSANQVGGTHYKHFAIQPVEFVHRNNLTYLEGSVIKYVCRHRFKAGRLDIEKAIHFLQMILEYEYGVTASSEANETKDVRRNSHR